VRVSVYIIIVSIVLYIGPSLHSMVLQEIKIEELPKHWEIEYNLNLENGDEMELSICMKHKMVSEAIWNGSKILSKER